MQLSYRGVNYETKTTYLPEIENLIVSKYRGLNYLIPERNIVVKKENLSLKYRGISYPRASVSSVKGKQHTHFREVNA